MTEQEMRLKLVNCAKSFFGAESGDSRHKEIVDVYNSYLPHPRGYKLTYNAPWCAGFVSAMAILCELTELVPVECSCNEQIKLWQKMGRWQEADDYRPNIGDLVYDDWQDNGNGDNIGEADHVGIVVWCAGGKILVIEGNKGTPGSVGYRELNVNGRYIRGYGLPNYASAEDKRCIATLPVLVRGMKGSSVRSLQALLNTHGASLDLDASFGPLTDAGVRSFQADRSLPVDGIVERSVWAALVSG